MGAAEEAAAGEVTDRKAWFYMCGPLLSSNVPHALCSEPPPDVVFSALDVVPASKTEPVELQRVEQVTCPTSFEEYKMGKCTGPHCIAPSRHEGACCVGTSPI